MKVISLLQPWATLAVIGAKKIETRSWNMKYRGDILIHASAGKKGLSMLEKEPYSDLNIQMIKAGIHQGYEFPLGCIIGKVNILKTAPASLFNAWFSVKKYSAFYAYAGKGMQKLNSKHELAFGDFSEGRYGWLLSDAVSFEDHHYPVKGSRGLWNFDPEICLQCGCTGEDACVHPDFGPCWWAEPYLCSHCAEGVLNPTSKNKINQK